MFYVYVNRFTYIDIKKKKDLHLPSKILWSNILGKGKKEIFIKFSYLCSTQLCVLIPYSILPFDVKMNIVPFF